MPDDPSIPSMPDWLAPWRDRFYSAAELALIGILQAGAQTPAEAMARISDRTAAGKEAFISRCVRRGVIDRETGRDSDTLEVADFHSRFELWAIFEGWQDLPPEIRSRLDRWELCAYADDKHGQIRALRSGAPLDPGQVWPAYLLLEEAERLLQRVGRIYLWPCNCRAMAGGCRQSLFTCLRFDNDRGLGWEISVSRAVEILHRADRRGLMHSGEVGFTTGGRVRGALCNCCPDCCYPHRLAEQTGMQKRWPFSRWVAAHDAAACDGCGRCVRRCPFGAFQRTAKPADRGKPAPVVLDRARCRGCGLCATGCPQAAVTMRPLPRPADLPVDRVLAADNPQPASG